MTDAYRRLAEDDGARFYRRSTSDRWTAADSDSITIVSDAMSIAEAARLYCEDKGLISPQEILDRVVAAYRPYQVLDEFWEGFTAWQHDAVIRRNPYRGVKARAWDRGASVAMLYQRATHHMATARSEPGWLVRLLRTGRR